MASSRLTLVACQRCKKPVPGHTACPYCGTYKGRDVIDVLSKLSKKEQKKRAKTEAKHDHEIGIAALYRPLTDARK